METAGSSGWLPSCRAGASAIASTSGQAWAGTRGDELEVLVHGMGAVSVALNDDPALAREADVMGARAASVAQAKSAGRAIPSPMASRSVQRTGVELVPSGATVCTIALCPAGRRL